MMAEDLPSIDEVDSNYNFSDSSLDNNFEQLNLSSNEESKSPVHKNKGRPLKEID